MVSRSPALKDVAFLIGSWTITLSNASFQLDKSQSASFSVDYRWIEGGTAIAVQQGSKDASPPQSANWIIGRDDSSKDYSVLYGDSRGVSRIYKMSFSNNIWKMWRDNDSFSQRFEARVSADQKTIEAKWEKSLDNGKAWEHDFNLTYKRQ